MPSNKALTRLVILLALAPGLSRAQAPAPTPSFTISASNSTMPSNGDGGIPITLTSVDGFAGTVVVGCSQPNTPASVIAPVCDYPGPVTSTYVLNANTTLNEVIGVSPPINTNPTARLNLPTHGTGHGERAIWSLAGVLMLGLGLRRRRARPSTRLLLAIGTLIGLTGISACGGPETLTPGTYTYTLTANDPYDTNNPLSVSTTATVTVPPGIVIHR